MQEEGDNVTDESVTVREDTLEDGEIGLVDATLTKAFGGPSASYCELQVHSTEVMCETNGDQAFSGKGDEVSNVAREDAATFSGDKSNAECVSCQCVINENMTGETNAINEAKDTVEGGTVQHEANILKVKKVLEATADTVEVDANREGTQSQHTVMNVQNSDRNDSFAVLEQTIAEDLCVIAAKLQAELEGRVFNSKQYHATKKTVQDFTNFKMRNDLEAMDTMRLEGVADLVKQMLISINNRGKTTPLAKDKNPYAHLAAPPAYKERPPDLVKEPVASTQTKRQDLILCLHEVSRKKC